MVFKKSSFPFNDPVSLAQGVYQIGMDHAVKGEVHDASLMAEVLRKLVPKTGVPPIHFFHVIGAYPHGIETIDITARVAAIHKIMRNGPSLSNADFRRALVHGIKLFKTTSFSLRQLHHVKLPLGSVMDMQYFDNEVRRSKPSDKLTKKLVEIYSRHRRF